MARWIGERRAGSVQLVSLGCGLAEKESHFLELWGGNDCRLDLIDGSAELVGEAKRRACRYLPARDICATVADLSQVSQWSDLVAEGDTTHRIFTLFGMLPNFDPTLLAERLRRALRSDDWLIVDANLVPDADDSIGSNSDGIPRSIVAQYDNEECREWLMAALTNMGIFGADGRLEVETISGSDEHSPPRIQAVFTLGRDVRANVAGRSFRFRKGKSLEVFYSIRHRTSTVRRFLASAGLRVVDSWLSNTGEDGVFLCRRIEQND